MLAPLEGACQEKDGTLEHLDTIFAILGNLVQISPLAQPDKT